MYFSRLLKLRGIHSWGKNQDLKYVESLVQEHVFTKVYNFYQQLFFKLHHKYVYTYIASNLFINVLIF